MIRLMIIDDHPIVCTGLESLISKVDDICIVGVAHDSTTGLRLVGQYKPDVVLLDVHIGREYGPTVMLDLRKISPQAKVLFFSVLPENSFALELLNSGASGFLNKSAPIAETLTAIREVARGRRYISEDLSLLALETRRKPDKTTLEGLSKRELDVLVLLVSGKKPKEIQEALSLGHGTVTTYIARLHSKLGTETTPELMRLAITLGL